MCMCKSTYIGKNITIFVMTKHRSNYFHDYDIFVTTIIHIQTIKLLKVVLLYLSTPLCVCVCAWNEFKYCSPLIRVIILFIFHLYHKLNIYLYFFFFGDKLSHGALHRASPVITVIIWLGGLYLRYKHIPCAYIYTVVRIQLYLQTLILRY